ncbi:MAG: hypothetical protein KBT11_05950 [Treponema sp.]|nr:hypothetical protein [Candidatus Treponema equifaecale]
MKKLGLRKVFMAFCCCMLLMSCVSTYHTTNVEVVSQSESDSSVHFIKNNQTINADNSLDGKLIAFYTFGMPFVVVGCTLREAFRVAGYSALNLVLGETAYERAKRGQESLGFIVPDTKKAKAELNEFQKEYEASDLYKYRQYRSALSKTTITKSNLVEEIDWNDNAKVISSTRETIKLQTSVADSASRVSKKASLIGSRIGTVTSVIFGIPSYILGFILGAAADD